MKNNKYVLLILITSFMSLTVYSQERKNVDFGKVTITIRELKAEMELIKQGKINYKARRLFSYRVKIKRC